MFDTDLYQQVLGLTAPWKVTDGGRPHSPLRSYPQKSPMDLESLIQRATLGSASAATP
jgi:hypothetical protein